LQFTPQADDLTGPFRLSSKPFGFFSNMPNLTLDSFYDRIQSGPHRIIVMRAAKPSQLSEFHELDKAGRAFERCQRRGPHDGLEHLPDLQNLVLHEILLFNAWLTEVKLHLLARNDPGEMDGRG
jgi:hypothetical protein